MGKHHGKLFEHPESICVPSEVHDLHLDWARLRRSGRLFVGKLWFGAQTTTVIPKTPKPRRQNFGMLPEVSVKWLLNGVYHGISWIIIAYLNVYHMVYQCIS